MNPAIPGQRLTGADEQHHALTHLANFLNPPFGTKKSKESKQHEKTQDAPGGHSPTPLTTEIIAPTPLTYQGDTSHLSRQTLWQALRSPSHGEASSSYFLGLAQWWSNGLRLVSGSLGCLRRRVPFGGKKEINETQAQFRRGGSLGVAWGGICGFTPYPCLQHCHCSALPPSRAARSPRVHAGPGLRSCPCGGPCLNAKPLQL